MKLQNQTNPTKSFSDRMRVIFKGILDPVAGFFNRLGVHPNTITLIGLAGHIGAAVLIIFGQVTWAGVVVVILAPTDALDGAMARLRGKPTRFGAFLDSVVDRFEEVFLIGGLLILFTIRQDMLGIILAYFTAVGSLLVSYTRSRAETLSFEAKNGLFSRLERYLLLIPALIFNFPLIALAILAVFTNFTALQRVFHVFMQSRKNPE